MCVQRETAGLDNHFFRITFFYAKEEVSYDTGYLSSMNQPCNTTRMEEKMAIIRFTERPNFMNPWAEFERIRRNMDPLSRNFANGDVNYPSATVFPPLNVYEEKEQLIIKAEIPGVKSDDLDISLEGETLTLAGTRKKYSDEDDNKSFHRREIERGTFSRAISLPTKVDPDKISASLKNGILTITISKAAEIKPRQVKVLSE